MPSRVVAHERDRMALVCMRDHEGGLARPEWHRGQYVEQLLMIMTIDFHNGEAECCRLLIKRLKIIGLSNRRPCWSRLRSTITVSRSSS